ncbi:MAG: alpha/beta fold hydrolase [Lysobacteraceae bacterium]
MPRSTPAWFTDFGQSSEAPIRLFTFAHSGGGASVFNKWYKALPGTHVLAARLPGRESRIAEPAHSAMGALIDTLAGQIAPRLDRPFALYGHSLGGLIAFELAHRLRELGLRQPERLLIGAYRSPERRSPHPELHALADADLVTGLKRYDSMPQSIIDSPELMALLVPMLRADFSLFETYTYRDRAPLDRPIVVYYGNDDRMIGPAEMDGWRTKSSADVRLHPIEAGHFFHLTHEAELLTMIAAELRGIAAVAN